MKTQSVLTANQVASGIPGGVRYGEQLADVTVVVCGNLCPDRDEVARQLREADTNVSQVGCLALCQTQGRLDSGTYALVPRSDQQIAEPTIIRS